MRHDGRSEWPLGPRWVSAFFGEKNLPESLSGKCDAHPGSNLVVSFEIFFLQRVGKKWRAMSTYDSKTSVAFGSRAQIVGNLGCVVGVVIMNKYIQQFHGFNFLIFLSFLHFVFTALGMRVLLAMKFLAAFLGFYVGRLRVARDWVYEARLRWRVFWKATGHVLEYV